MSHAYGWLPCTRGKYIVTGEDGKPEIIPEEAEVVRRIFREYLAGASLRMIKESLLSEGIPDVSGKDKWTITTIRSILTNEKYCGDVLLQKLSLIHI